jgi:hypothetical protein
MVVRGQEFSRLLDEINITFLLLEFLLRREVFSAGSIYFLRFGGMPSSAAGVG